MRKTLVSCTGCALVLAGCAGPGTDLAQDAASGTGASAADAGALGPRTACAWQECGSRAQAVQVLGTSPYGPVEIARIGAIYTHGFTGSTHVVLEGSVAGEALRIDLVPYTDVVPDPAWEAAPGAYETARDSYVGLMAAVSLRDTGGLCAHGHLVNARLEIEEHAVSHDLAPGAALTLRGRVEIDGGGWSLATDLEIPVICDSSNSL